MKIRLDTVIMISILLQQWQKTTFMAPNFTQKRVELWVHNFTKFFVIMIVYQQLIFIDGQCVRLTKGAYDTKTVYSDSPVEVAKRFEGAGLTHCTRG